MTVVTTSLLYSDSSDFPSVLAGLMAETGLSAYRLAEESGVDRAYLSRLLSGTKRRPSERTVMNLCLTLYKVGVHKYRLDELRVSAGYPPVFEMDKYDILQLLVEKQSIGRDDLSTNR